MLLLAIIACTCAPPPTEPPAPAPTLPEVRRPLCTTPLACGLLVHYSLDTVQTNVCDWCGEESPALCGTWLPAAPGATEPRCAIYRELELCILQHASTTRFADLPEMAKTNVLALQDREDQRVDCIE